MKQERILYALENVSAEYIMESMPSENKRTRLTWTVLACAAAALLLVIGVSYYRMRQQQEGILSEIAEAEQESVEIETVDDMNGLMEQSSSGDEHFVDVKELLALADAGQTAVTENAQRIMHVSMGEYTAIYENIESSGKEAFHEAVYAARGSSFSESENLSYVSGHTDKQYLIQAEGDDVSLWKFVCFDAEDYPFRDVLTEVYDVHSGEAFAELIVSAGNMDNTAEGLRIQQEIGTHNVTDRSALIELYRILCRMTCYGMDRWDLIQTGSQDADVSGAMADAHQEVRLTRYLTIVTPYIEIDSLKYTAASGMFYEFGGIAYEPLSAKDAEIMRNMLEIDAPSLDDGDASENNVPSIQNETTIESEETRAKPIREDNYLLTVQEEVSSAMARGELPFVVSSSYREDIGKVIITVTTQDEALLSKLRDYDADGSVLIIEYDATGDAVLE